MCVGLVSVKSSILPMATPSASIAAIIASRMKINGDSSKGGSHTGDTTPDFPQTQIFADLDKEDGIVKYRRYESDYTNWLMAKYFSNKTIYGGDIFEEKVIVDGESIKASRWPFTRTYTDPILVFEESIGKDSTPAAGETATAVFDGTRTPEKAMEEAMSFCRLQ